MARASTKAAAASGSATLDQVMARLEAVYKDDTELFPDLTAAKQIDVIPSPSAIINAISGIGGMPRGRMVEIHGPFSSGKTTIAIEECVACQQADPGHRVAYIDFEHAFDAVYGRKLGLNLGKDQFIFAQPTYFEQGAEIIDMLVSNNLVDMVVIDSAAAMTPKADLLGEIDKDGGGQKGTQAALMARFLDRITKKLNRGRKPCLVLINQTRAVINIGGRPDPRAEKEQAAGGNGIKFYASQRYKLEIISQEGDENRNTGGKGTDQIYTQNRVRVTCVKNKLAPPFMRGSLVIEYGKGINNILSIGELAEAKLGIMSGAGFFKYEGDKPTNSFSCRGREAFLEMLGSNPDLQQEIERKVIEAIQAEHAASLGLEKISVAGKAKEVQSTAGTLTLTDDEEDEVISDLSQEPGQGPGGFGLEVQDID